MTTIELLAADSIGAGGWTDWMLLALLVGGTLALALAAVLTRRDDQ